MQVRTITLDPRDVLENQETADYVNKLINAYLDLSSFPANIYSVQHEGEDFQFSLTIPIYVLEVNVIAFKERINMRNETTERDLEKAYIINFLRKKKKTNQSRNYFKKNADYYIVHKHAVDIYQFDEALRIDYINPGIPKNRNECQIIERVVAQARSLHSRGLLDEAGDAPKKLFELTDEGYLYIRKDFPFTLSEIAGQIYCFTNILVISPGLFDKNVTQVKLIDHPGESESHLSHENMAQIFSQYDQLSCYFTGCAFCLPGVNPGEFHFINVSRNFYKRPGKNNADPSVMKAEIMHKKIVGEGSYGSVHKIKQTLNLTVQDNNYTLSDNGKNHRHRAVKRIMTEGDQRYIALMTREYEIGSLVEYMHMKPPIYFNDGLSALVPMAYLKGSELFTIIEDDLYDATQHLTTAMRFQYAIQLLAVLAQLHAKNIIHRDLKPENIMVDENGLYIYDFGLAALSSKLNKDEPVGTLLYRAPEVNAASNVSEKADVYSAGIIIAELFGYKRHDDGIQTREHILKEYENGICFNTIFSHISSAELSEDHREGIFQLVYVMTLFDPARRYSSQAALDKLSEIYHKIKQDLSKEISRYAEKISFFGGDPKLSTAIGKLSRLVMDEDLDCTFDHEEIALLKLPLVKKPILRMETMGLLPRKFQLAGQEFLEEKHDLPAKPN